MKPLFVAVLGAAMSLATTAAAECEAAGAFPLDESIVTLEGCGELSETCLTAEQLLARYAASSNDGDDPSLLTVGIQSSPWRFYGPGDRIITPAELADMLRGELKPEIREVQLQASWTGYVPVGRTTSLAQEVSAHLTGVGVSGPSGFVWFKPDGLSRVSRQGFTGLHGAMYTANAGEEVMAAAAVFVAPQLKHYIPVESHGDFMLRRGLSEDVFGLCPANALEAFREAAALGNPVGAYNAAVMLLERNIGDDREDARDLLTAAAELGDEPSRALLARTFAP